MRLLAVLLGAAALGPAPQAEVTAAYEQARALLLKASGTDQISEADLRSSTIEGKRYYRLCGQVQLARPTKFIVHLARNEVYLSALSRSEVIGAERAGAACHDAYARWARGDSVDKEQAKALCEKAIPLGQKREAEATFQLSWAVLCTRPDDEQHPFVR